MIHEGRIAPGNVERYVEVGLADGADLLCGGVRPKAKELQAGYFHEPTIFARVEPNHRIAQEEIFGPVLSVIRVSTADEAFAVNNGVKYGLSSSVYTRDVNLAFRALNELDNGITYINAPTIGAEAHLPFGGVKQTGNGAVIVKEGGRCMSSTPRPKWATSIFPALSSARRSITMLWNEEKLSRCFATFERAMCFGGLREW